MTDASPPIPPDDDTAEAWLRKGNAAFELEKFEEALDFYQKAIALNPENDEYYNKKGIALRHLKQYQDAIEAYDQAIALDPKFAGYYNNKGIALYELKKYPDAIAAYDQAIALDPKDARIYNNKGLVLSDLKQYQAAIAAFDQAIALDPKNAFPHNGKGNTLYHLKQYQDAIAAFDQAIALDPNHAVPHNGKGNALSELKQYQAAIAAYDQAIALDPKDATPYNGKGNALYHLKQYQDAIAAYDQAIALDPKDARIYNNKGNALYHLKQYQDAIAAFDQAIALDPNHAVPHNGKGNTLYHLKQYQDAIAAFDQAIALDPKDAWPHNGKGNALAELGQYPGALIAYDRAIALDLDNPLYRRTKALLVRRKKLYEYDNDFKSILGADYINDNWHTEKLETFKNLWDKQADLLDLLQVSFDEDEVDCVAHYRSINSFENYIGISPRLASGEQPGEHQALKMTGVDTANDPMEGKTLQYFLGDPDHSGETDNVRVLQSSFCHEIDNLTLFRFYGKDGAGLCLIFNKHLFAEKYYDATRMSSEAADDCAPVSASPVEDSRPKVIAASPKKRPAATTYKRHLYWAIYYDAKAKSFSHLPLQTSIDSSENFFAEKYYDATRMSSEAADDCAPVSASPVEDSRPKVIATPQKKRPAAATYKRHLYWVLYYDTKAKDFRHLPSQMPPITSNTTRPEAEKELRAKLARHSNVASAMDALKGAYEKAKDVDPARAWQLLIYVRHLVKDAGYADEREMRILTLCQRDHQDIFELVPGRRTVAMNYQYILDQDNPDENPLVEVIGGPKIADFDQQAARWKQAIEKYCGSIKVSFTKSTAPLA